MTTKVTVSNDSEDDSSVVIVQCINPFNDGVLPNYTPKALKKGEKLETHIHSGIGLIVKELQVKR